MKTFRIILLLAIISFFSSISSSVNAKDCSGLTVLSKEWFACKKENKGENKSLLATEKIKKKGMSFFKKLKNFGGKNIGEEG